MERTEKKYLYFYIPEQTRNKLTATELKVFYTIFDLLNIRQNNYPDKTAYVTPSEIWIAKKLQKTREWVSKCIQKLKRLNLLIVIRRRKEKGKWATNLYMLGLCFYNHVRNREGLLTGLFSHVNRSSHIVKNAIKDKKEKEQMEEKKHLIEKALDKLRNPENKTEPFMEQINKITERILEKITIHESRITERLKRKANENRK